VGAGMQDLTLLFSDLQSRGGGRGRKTENQERVEAGSGPNFMRARLGQRGGMERPVLAKKGRLTSAVRSSLKGKGVV